jgi:hypothetical protein
MISVVSPFPTKNLINMTFSWFVFLTIDGLSVEREREREREANSMPQLYRKRVYEGFSSI